MAISDENGTGMVMPVAPMGNGGNGWGTPYAVPVNYGYGGGFGGGWGGDMSWLIILFLFGMMGGYGGMNGMGGLSALPWLFASNANSDNLVQGGFNQAATAGSLAGIQSSLTTGFSNAEVASCNRAMDAMQTAYNNEIAGLNRSFAAQTAVDGRLDSLEMSLQKCCCDNQLATESLRYTVATENAADRAELSNGVRDIIANQTAGTQRILDKLCDQELQAERRENDQLRTQLNMANLAASQSAQTAAIVADNNAQTQYLVNRIAPYPQPAVVVGYGCNGYGYNNGFSNGFGGFNGGFGTGFNPGFGNVGFGNGSF